MWLSHHRYRQAGVIRLASLALHRGNSWPLQKTLWVFQCEAGNFVMLMWVFQLTFMASYPVVLALVTSLMAVDFFLIKGQNFDIYELYRPEGTYRFAAGWN